jgi:hypothetical protein
MYTQNKTEERCSLQLQVTNTLVSTHWSPDPNRVLLPTSFPSGRHASLKGRSKRVKVAAGTAYCTGFNSQSQLGLGHEDDVEVARLIKSKAVKEMVLTWAGAGGQFSVIAAPSKPSGDSGLLVPSSPCGLIQIGNVR